MTDNRTSIPLTLVIPCYNESDRIGLLYDGLASFMHKWKDGLEVIIVNDGSKDNTGELLQSHEIFQAHRDRISVYSQDNTGKGGALKNGVLRAHGEFVCTLDADMATSPEEVIKWQQLLQQPFDSNTIYIGSREHAESIIHNEKPKRKIAGNIFNFIVRSLTHLPIKDTQCGFKLYPASVARNLFANLETYGWAHDVELLYKAHMDGVAIKEMPIEWTAIEGSKIRLLHDAVKMFTEVLTITQRVKKTKK